MKIPFNTAARKRIVIAIAATLAILYVGVAGRLFMASWLDTRAEVKSLERAVWFDPGNAEYRNHLGRYYSLVAHDPVQAVAQYAAAVQLNPHSARLWFDLAGAHQVLGDVAQQTAALENAIQADATTPDVAWEAANLYLVQGEKDKALREFRVVLANDATLAEPAIQTCWRLEPDVDVLLRDVVPPHHDAYTALLDLLERKKDTAGTKKVWDALLHTHQMFERRHSDQYFRYLIQEKDVDQALLVWQQTANRFGLSAYLPSAGNLVVNNSFSLDVLNTGFDWQYHKEPGVNLTLDPSDYHAGLRSLLITFDGPGITDAGIFQLIAVQPNTMYEFTGYYKNSEMAGAGGPHFTIQDVYNEKVYYDSDELKDSGFWKSADGVFTTGPNCKLVLLHVRRLPAGSPLRGKLWIDDFHITRKSS